MMMMMTMTSERCKSARVSLFALAAAVLVLTQQLPHTRAADVVIEIPGNLGQADSSYRLDYHPPYGTPLPNTTIASQDVGGAGVIQFSNVLPGTKYNFWLYYTNTTHDNLLAYTVSIMTAPDPPSNLSVAVRNDKTAVISWSPPSQGNFSSFKLRLLGLSDAFATNLTVLLPEGTFDYKVSNLTAGASFQVQAYTIFKEKESLAYTSRNFTTKPNTPGKFIVWFRNETTLLVLWQPPYPAGIYTHYKVSIEPPDAIESVLYVEKEGEPPGPAQAAFKGLVPGRAYNISVQTMSEDEISLPTTAQYRTVPLKPMNVTFVPDSVSTTGFKVMWEAPRGASEFDKYQVSLATSRRQQTIARGQHSSVSLEFKEALEPGRTYQVIVKTVSGKVTSWPATADLIIKPLPVHSLEAFPNSKTGEITLQWLPNANSTQDEYKISYHEGESFADDSNTIVTNETDYHLVNLLPGRNYSITVQAMSAKIDSDDTQLHVITRPAAPIIEDLKSIREGLNISWKSDVNSRQDVYEVWHKNNRTGVSKTVSTNETGLVIRNLYPGDGYDVKVFAVSHSQISEPHAHFQAVYPNPPTNMTIEKVTSNSVLVKWQPPKHSTYQEFAIRYRTESENQWIRLPSVVTTEADVTDMTPGEKYTIQVNSVSYTVESPKPQQVNHTVRPNPVSNILPLADSTNITLEWPRPEGRIESYAVNWWPVEQPGQKHHKVLQEMVISPPETPTKVDAAGGTASAVSGPSVPDIPVVRALIDDLFPGVEYKFEINSKSYDLFSDLTQLSVRTLPLIQSELFVITDVTNNDVLNLTYTPTPQSISRFDHYRLSLGDTGIEDKVKHANDTDRHVTFTGLTPGRLYNITIWTVSAKVQSLPIQRQDRMFPNPIANLTATSVTDHAITLAWQPPPGEYNTFEIMYLKSDTELGRNLTMQPHFTIGDLRPFRNYTFTVGVRSGTESTVLRNSVPISDTIETLESVPGTVTDFVPQEIHPTSIVFKWQLLPSDVNGIIQQFTITYGLEGSTHTLPETFRATEQTGRIGGLEPGKTYEFRIQARTAIGFGPESVWKERMPILAPPRPELHSVPSEVNRGSTTILIRFRKNYFLDTNGKVTSYTIIVAEDDTKNASGLEMLSWLDVQSYKVWPPYQVIEAYNPFVNTSVEDFTIGTERCDQKTSNYCNGPLRAGTSYRVKVRAFTDADKFTDTAYSFPITTDTDQTALIVGIIVPISVILLLLLAVIWVRRRNGQIRKQAKESRVSDNLSMQDSVVETSRPVSVSQFAEHYRMMSADSDFRFSEEFEELKHVGRDQPNTFADLPCNRPKNRFTNILPYDHSRFKLQPVDDDEGSDYINANYVPGYNSPREFIVTQGPLHSTRDDFWRMCWESNSRAIVMLTRCFEKGREKCDQYWPNDTQPMYYGDIKVQILNDSHYPDWAITEFMICRGNEQRKIRHFHFITWPDFGVPNPPQTLVRFVRAFRERIGADQRPICVHCSAGVGRSGTFITLDRILQSIQVNDTVDIFGIVWAMRKERVWMVQTEQQYICIHQCLMAVLEGQENLNNIQRELHDNQGYEVIDHSAEEHIIQANAIDALSLSQVIIAADREPTDANSADDDNEEDGDDDDDDDEDAADTDEAEHATDHEPRAHNGSDEENRQLLNGDGCAAASEPHSLQNGRSSPVNGSAEAARPDR